MRGRFAPSPTGALHLGNLRTALLAWTSARAQHGEFTIRMEDLDPVTSSLEHERGQLDDLVRLGIGSDEPVVRQSERFDRYRAAIELLAADGLVYHCFCTRREIREASSAPNDPLAPDGAYPGTCRELTTAQRAGHERAGRRAALRLRTDGQRITVHDAIAGEHTGAVDDVVLQRNDGVPAYNLAVVVDDAAQGVTEVVRGDDLLSSTPRQIHLQQLLGLSTPTYAHVPLVVGPDGHRLAKRHGATGLDDWAAAGVDADRVRVLLLDSLGLRDGRLPDPWSFDVVPRRPWTCPPPSR